MTMNRRSSSDLNPGPADHNQQTLPYARRLPRSSPLSSILQSALAFDAPSQAQKTKLRKHVARTVPAMPCAELEQFLCAMFEQDDLLAAYFRPTELYVPGAPAQLKTVLPFDVAMVAARRASVMPVLFPHERCLALLAALAYPSAMFHAADPSLRSLAHCRGAGREQDLNLLRQVLLKKPLRALRRRNSVLAATLAAALGFAASDECEPRQVARLVSSVRLATLNIDHLWRGLSNHK
jgi:hypothetical protein